MTPLPRRLVPVLLLGSLLLLVLATAAICGDSDDEKVDGAGAAGGGSPPAEATSTGDLRTPAVSPEPTEPIPTPAALTPEGGAQGAVYACDRSGPGDRIDVEAPEDGAVVSSPVTVSGTASVFEATVQIVVRQRNGDQIGGMTATASEGAPGTGTFEVSVAYDLAGGPQEGCIEVFSVSPRDGSAENMVSVPVMLE